MVNREVLWQKLRMYDVGSKLLNGIKSMYVARLACVGSSSGSIVLRERDASCPLISIYIWTQ